MNKPLLIRPAKADIDVLSRNHQAMALETEGKALDPLGVLPGTRAENAGVQGGD